MSLRIAWLGPWNARSAIAIFGRFVVAELAARNHDVTVFRTEVGSTIDEPALPTPVRVKCLQASDPSVFGRAFDGVVANVGDHYLFHGGVLELLERCPCLVIFHDGVIANLAAGWAYNAAGGEVRLRTLVKHLYGETAWPEGTNYWDWGELDTIAAVRPMTEWLAPLAAGIVTHSGFWKSRMQAACSGRVHVLPLAWMNSNMPSPRPLGVRVVIASIGHANPNRRADQVLLAIASDPLLRSRCEYRLLGPVEGPEQKRLQGLAADLGLAPPRMTGWLSDAALRAEMAEVDIISCLRYPVLEAGSASLVTAMYSGRPILTSRQGVYAEVPSDIVFHCTPGREPDDIAVHLRAILADPAASRAMGQRAQAYAAQFHSAARYVDGLLPAIAAATAAAPAIAAARRLGKLLGRFNISPDDPAVTRVAGELSQMLAC